MFRLYGLQYESVLVKSLEHNSRPVRVHHELGVLFGNVGLDNHSRKVRRYCRVERYVDIEHSLISVFALMDQFLDPIRRY